MSWLGASKLSRQIAEKYDGVRKVSPERMEDFRRRLNRLDQEALTEWLHRRLAQEFQGFSAACRINYEAEATIPDIPSLKRLS